MRLLVVTTKIWNIKNFVNISKKLKKHEWTLIDTPDNLNLKNLKIINPEIIFFIHWSTIIEEKIFKTYKCILFHMTDLPYGRGGSPLQNLIIRKHKSTMVSAINVNEIIDGGDIYLKNKLGLSGSAGEIFKRLSKLIFFKMIPEILDMKSNPEPQIGDPVIFKRRTPKDSDINASVNVETLEDIYDFIRMLDAETYPNAFLDFKKFRIYFHDATFEDGKITTIAEIKENYK